MKMPVAYVKLSVGIFSKASSAVRALCLMVVPPQSQLEMTHSLHVVMKTV